MPQTHRKFLVGFK
jgi:hypothetical protein